MNLPPGHVLTPRQLDVVRHAASGHSNADTGKALWLTEDTVKAHLRRAYQVLGARDRAHAVAICLIRGWLDPRDVELPGVGAGRRTP